MRVHQASAGWKKNIQNYGKWAGAVKKYPELLEGIVERAGGALRHFGYVDGDGGKGGGPGPGLGAWDYTAAGGVDCTAALGEPCPAAAAHQQKCM